MTKTFKIGEYAAYGIWRVEVNRHEIILQGIDYTSKKIEENHTFPRTMKAVNGDISDVLHDVTSFYYADKIIKWITSKLLYKTT